MTFILTDKVPSAGYIQVKMPPQVVLNPATTLSTASCKVYTCLDATESGIKLLIAGDSLEKGTKVEL